MPRICVWCGGELESETERREGKPSARETGAGEFGSTAQPCPSICRRCADGLAAYRKPILVVSRDWARLYDRLVELLKGQPEIQVIVDRRQPAVPGAEAARWDGQDRRKKGQPLIVE